MVLLPLSVASPEDVDQGVTGYRPAHLYDVFLASFGSLSIRNCSLQPTSGTLPRRCNRLPVYGKTTYFVTPLMARLHVPSQR